MAKVVRAALVDAAKDLNTVLDLSPAIDVKLGVDELRELMLQAITYIKDGDELKESTRAVIHSLTEDKDETSDEAPARRSTSDGTATAAAKRKAAPPVKYEGSTAQRLDTALLKGGKLDKLSEELGVNKGQIKAHAKFRAKSGKFKLSEDGDTLKLDKVAA